MWFQVETSQSVILQYSVNPTYPAMYMSDWSQVETSLSVIPNYSVNPTYQAIYINVWSLNETYNHEYSNVQ